MYTCNNSLVSFPAARSPAPVEAAGMPLVVVNQRYKARVTRGSGMKAAVVTYVPTMLIFPPDNLPTLLFHGTRGPRMAIGPERGKGRGRGRHWGRRGERGGRADKVPTEKGACAVTHCRLG